VIPVLKEKEGSSKQKEKEEKKKEENQLAKSVIDR
jgi:COP9 signalosome complex subunit 5